MLSRLSSVQLLDTERVFVAERVEEEERSVWTTTGMSEDGSASEITAGRKLDNWEESVGPTGWLCSWVIVDGIMKLPCDWLLVMVASDWISEEDKSIRLTLSFTTKPSHLVIFGPALLIESNLCWISYGLGEVASALRALLKVL